MNIQDHRCTRDENPGDGVHDVGKNSKKGSSLLGFVTFLLFVFWKISLVGTILYPPLGPLPFPMNIYDVQYRVKQVFNVGGNVLHRDLRRNHSSLVTDDFRPICISLPRKYDRKKNHIIIIRTPSDHLPLNVLGFLLFQWYWNRFRWRKWKLQPKPNLYDVV